MIRVRQEYCVACGLCADQCPQGAIQLAFGRAWIDQRRCTSCYRCMGVCPQGAIREEVQVSLEEVKALVKSVRGKANSIVRRIDELT